MSPYLAYLYSFVIIIGLEISLLKSSWFGRAVVIIIIFNLFFVWAANRFKFNLDFFNFLISPLLFSIGGLLFLFFSDSFLLKEIVIFFLVIANTVFLRYLIIHNYHKYQYQRHSLSNVSRVINVSTIFFLFTGFFDLHSFFRTPWWILSGLSFLAVALTVYQFFCINKIKQADNRYFISLISIALLEIFFIVHWLPLISYVKGMLMVSAYYFAVSLSKHYVLGTIGQPVYLRYALATGAIWLAVLSTARWT